jgi:hypothetical protein
MRNTPRGRGWTISLFVVKDDAKDYKELISKGATSAVSPKESEGTEIYVKDPDGIWIELLSSG